MNNYNNCSNVFLRGRLTIKITTHKFQCIVQYHFIGLSEYYGF